MGRFIDLLGTTLSGIQFGIGGLRLKNAASKLRSRNAADNADAPIVGSVVAASGDTIQINEDAAGSGADWLYTINRPASGMTAAVALTLPPTAGSPGQALTTDGAGNLSFVTVAAGTDKIVTDTTTIAFGSASPVSMFTLPANAVVESVHVVVDTPFNGAPSLTVGIAGTTAKYLAASSVDLTAATGTSFEVAPGLASVGTTEALIATYAAGGATAGSARVIVAYSIPS